MEKEVNKYKNNISLSRYESALLNAVGPFKVFSAVTAGRAIGWGQKRVANVLASLKRKGIIASLKRNSYTLTEGIPENLLLIATEASAPAYVSFWTAFSIYGFTEQQPSAIQVVSTRQRPSLRVSGHVIEITTVRPQRFFGYTAREGFAIAEVEKLLVDSLARPDKIGSIAELKKCLKNAWPQTDQRKLLRYLKRFGKKALFARLGHLVEDLGLACSITSELLKQVPRSYAPLDLKGEAPHGYDGRWMVRV